MSLEISYMLLITFTVPFFIFFFLTTKKRGDYDTTRLPPGPKQLPIIGNLHQIGKLPHRSLLSLSKKYGDLLFLKLGSAPALVVSSAEMAREIFKTHDHVFSGRPLTIAGKKYSYDGCSISGAPYGDYWREVRKIAVLELMTVKRVQSFQHVRAEEMARMLDSIVGAKNQVVDLTALVFSLTNKIISRVAFSMSNSDEKSRKFQAILHEAQQMLVAFNVADYFPSMGWVNKFTGLENRLEKNIQDLDSFFDQVIEEHLDRRRPAMDHEDIVDALLRIQKDPSQAITLTNDQLKGVLVDIFAGATDTSTATIIWVMSELMRNKIVRRKVQEEVRQVAKGKPKVEEADLPKLTYLKLVIKEALRLHPPAPLLVPRETTEKCIIDNKYEIPAKTRVIVNAVAIQTDPRHWENPEMFIPDRFLDSPIDFRGQHFELLPFGGGRRGCPGINFSIPLVELPLANLLYCFDWELPKGMKVEDLDMEEELGMTMHKKSPLCLVASPSN